jgi:uncharacterized membrane protein YdjX (TVP38/TMEM64 family)
LKQSRTAYIVLLVPTVGLALGYLLHEGFRAQLSTALAVAISAEIAPMRDYLLAFGWWAPVVSTALLLLTSIIAPLPSFMLAVANAMLFGVWWGGLLTWSSALLAAAMCFGIARVFGRPAVEHFVPRAALSSTDAFFLRVGVFAVVLARVVPFINPDVVSYAAGLTPMRLRLFIASTAAGSIPSTVLYSYLGSRGATSIGWLFLPLIILGLLAFGAAVLHHYRFPVTPPPVTIVENANEIA